MLSLRKVLVVHLVTLGLLLSNTAASVGGGINHQPCRRYLRESTYLSRSLSRALADFQLANVALEDALLSEMDTDEARVVFALNRGLTMLGASINGLNEAKSNLGRLLSKMDELAFQDLPDLRELPLDKFGQVLLEQGLLATLIPWKRATTILRKGGYYAMMKVFSEEIDALHRHTVALWEGFSELREKSPSPGIQVVLERNLPGNIRPEFAAVYSRWAEFNALYLCSSLISVELSYRDQGYGSLSSLDW